MATSEARSTETQRTTGRVVWLGTEVDYREALDLQRCIALEVAGGTVPDTLLFLEHAPVYTAGPRSPDDHVLGGLPAPLVQTDRGGQITYHGPGQLVGYPIVNLASKGLGPKAYVRLLERALLQTLSFFCILAHTEEGLTGVWTKRGKIAAIGVKISRGVSTHGFALNVTTDLSAYGCIVPCGIPDRPVTSVTQVLGGPEDVSSLRQVLTERLGEQLGVSFIEVSSDELASSVSSTGR